MPIANMLFSMEFKCRPWVFSGQSVKDSDRSFRVFYTLAPIGKNYESAIDFFTGISMAGRTKISLSSAVSMIIAHKKPN